jgi:hypothetical protein
MVCMRNSCAVDGGSGARRGEQRGAAVLRQGPAFACQCAVGCAACGYECADRQGGFTGDRGQTERDKVADNRTSKPRRERRSVTLARLRHLCSLLSLWCTIALNYKRDSTSLVRFGHNRSIRQTRRARKGCARVRRSERRSGVHDQRRRLSPEPFILGEGHRGDRPCLWLG